MGGPLRLWLDQVECGSGCRPVGTEIRSDTNRVAILFVDARPSDQDCLQGRPLGGRGGRVLRRIIRDLAPDISYGICTRYRCAGSETSCANLLERDIRRYDPDVLCLLGPEVLDRFGQKGRRRADWWTQEVEGRDRAVTTTWSTNLIGNHVERVSNFYADIRFALRLAQGWRPSQRDQQLGTTRLITTVDGVADLVDSLIALPRGSRVAFDVETKGLGKQHGNRLGLLQFSHDGDVGWCVPLDHPQTPFDPGQLGKVRGLLARLFTQRVNFQWVTHFGKFEQTQVGRHILDRGDGIARTFRNAPMMDTGAFAYLLDENETALDRGRSYGLKRLASRHLGFHHYDSETLKLRTQGSLFHLPLGCPVPIGEPGWFPNLADYGAMDAYVTRRLFDALVEEATLQRFRSSALRLLEHLFGPVFATLSMIERNGFWGNLQHLQWLRDPEASPVVARLREIDKKDLRGCPSAIATNQVLVAKQSGGSQTLFGTPWVLDLNRPAHVSAWLIDQVGLKPLSTGKSGAPSIDKPFLAAHKDVPEVKLLEERRGLAKLQTGYINKLIGVLELDKRAADTQDGRVRCDLLFTSTTSGRGTSEKPNMQQQPRSDTEVKQAIKNIWQAEQPGVEDSFHVDFRAGPVVVTEKKTALENCLVQLDFMASEARWWGILSKCPDLARAFNKGKAARDLYRREPTEANKAAAELGGDIHRQTASLMFGVPVEEVDKILRTASKSIVFGALFGRGAGALAQQLGKTKKEAEKLLDRFSSAFPVGWAWLQRCPDRARSSWQIPSGLGRRRRLYQYCLGNNDSHVQWALAEADRVSKNFPIQSISSDATFLGNDLFARYIEENNLPWLLQMIVHDSCVYQVPIRDLEESMRVAERCFTTETMGVVTGTWGVEFNCPIEVEFEIGLRWGDLTRWDFSAPQLDTIMASLQQAA